MPHHGKLNLDFNAHIELILPTHKQFLIKKANTRQGITRLQFNSHIFGLLLLLLLLQLDKTADAPGFPAISQALLQTCTFFLFPFSFTSCSNNPPKVIPLYTNKQINKIGQRKQPNAVSKYPRSCLQNTSYQLNCFVILLFLLIPFVS